MAGTRPVNPLIEFVEQLPATNLLYCGDSPQAVVSAIPTSSVTHIKYADIDTLSKRYDLAILYDCLEHLTLREGHTLIGKLRNAITPRIWVLNTLTCHWQLNDFIGLGFKNSGPIFFPQQKLNTYFYDISTYNKKRQWNNPKNWANPENWNKYRW